MLLAQQQPIAFRTDKQKSLHLKNSPITSGPCSQKHQTNHLCSYKTETDEPRAAASERISPRAPRAVN